MRSLAAQSIEASAVARIAAHLRTLSATSESVAAVTRLLTFLRTLAASGQNVASVGRLLALFRTLSTLGVNAASVTTSVVTALAAPVRRFLSHMLTRTTDLAARFSATDQTRGRRLAGTKGQYKLPDTDQGRGRTISGTDDPSDRKPGTGGVIRR